MVNIEYNESTVCSSYDMELLIWRKCTHEGRANFKSYGDFRLHQRVPQLLPSAPAIAEGLNGI